MWRHWTWPFDAGGGSLHFNDLVAANGKEAGGSSPVDLVYLKNVLLKFIIAASEGKIEQVSTGVMGTGGCAQLTDLFD